MAKDRCTPSLPPLSSSRVPQGQYGDITRWDDVTVLDRMLKSGKATCRSAVGLCIDHLGTGSHPA